MSTDQQIVDRFNKLVQQMGLWPTRRMPRYRYWRVKNDKYAYGWTTERDSHRKFYAFVYRITKQAWKLGKKVAFGRRKKAKERAYHWYCQRKEKLAQKP